MYESFFHLKARPFAATPLVDNYYPGGSIEQSRQTSIRAVERTEGPVLVIGPSGVGKSLLCRLLSAYFAESFRVVLLSNTQIGTRKALLQHILFELGLPYRQMDEGELRLSLIDHLQPSENCPNGMLLVVDEAHTLPIRLLEEIRMITNVVREGQARVRLVLVGGPRLEERFASPKLESFNQRLAARCYLQTLSREENDQYVRSQIAGAGGAADSIFSEDAFRAIYQATDGIPRLVNQVCNHALTLACQAGKRMIDAAAIEEAWADLQQLPGPWNETAVETDNSQAFIEFGDLDADTSAVFPAEVPPEAPVDSTEEPLLETLPDTPEEVGMDTIFDNSLESDLSLASPIDELGADPLDESVLRELQSLSVVEIGTPCTDMSELAHFENPIPDVVEDYEPIPDIAENHELDAVVEELGSADVVEELESAAVVEELESAAVVEELESADVVEELGSADVVEELGSADVVEELGSADPLESDESSLDAAGPDNTDAETVTNESDEIVLETAPNPFDVAFDEEEVIVDPFVQSLETLAEPAVPELTTEAPEQPAVSEPEEELAADTSGPCAMNDLPTAETTDQPECCDNLEHVESMVAEVSAMESQLEDESPADFDDTEVASEFADDVYPREVEGDSHEMFEYTVFETSENDEVLYETSGIVSGPVNEWTEESDEEDVQCVSLPGCDTRPSDDRDLIEVADEEPATGEASDSDVNPEGVRRVEYRELFAQLRRSE